MESTTRPTPSALPYPTLPLEHLDVFGLSTQTVPSQNTIGNRLFSPLFLFGHSIRVRRVPPTPTPTARQSLVLLELWCSKVSAATVANQPRPARPRLVQLAEGGKAAQRRCGKPGRAPPRRSELGWPCPHLRRGPAWPCHTFGAINRLSRRGAYCTYPRCGLGQPIPGARVARAQTGCCRGSDRVYR